MELKYFGCINDPSFFELNEDDQNVYLNEKDLYRRFVSVTSKLKLDDKIPGRYNSDKIPISEQNIVYEPSNELAEDFYNYVLYVYEAYLKYLPTIFNLNFNNLTFGIIGKERRPIALSEFNRVYKEIFPDEIDSMRNRFEALNGKQSGNKNLLVNQRALLLEYLVGNSDFFDKKIYETNEALHNAVEFEGNLEILLHLNQTYNFGIDLYFSNDAKLHKVFNKIENPSFDFKVFRFIDRCINSIKKHHHSQVVSLFFFLKKSNLILESAVSFHKMITSHYQLKIGEIKLSSNINEKHHQRMNKFERDWFDYNN